MSAIDAVIDGDADRNISDDLSVRNIADEQFEIANGWMSVSVYS